MVAISLYKGNLHKVPDTPRQWLMPTRNISLKDFRTLLRRRSRALSRLPAPPPPAAAAPTAPTTPTATSSNPNPNSKTDPKSKPEGKVPVLAQVKTEKEEDVRVENAKSVGSSDVRVENAKLVGSSGVRAENVKSVGSSDVRVEIVKSVVSSDVRVEIVKSVGSSDAVVVPPKVDVLENHQKVEVQVKSSGVEKSNKEDAVDEQKRKEIEDKLQALNMKKHGLVQLLKQILNAEEELKRRSMQAVAVRSSLPLQVDTTNDTGSMTKLNTPRMGSDGNPIGEVDGDGGDDASNQNTLSRNLLRMNSTSPSSDSQLRKTPYNVVPLSSRSVGVTVSPSRFAPPGQLGQSSNLPPMSLSGTNFVTSSPSPVASGSTSAFRDRFSSP